MTHRTLAADITAATAEARAALTAVVMPYDLHAMLDSTDQALAKLAALRALLAAELEMDEDRPEGYAATDAAALVYELRRASAAALAAAVTITTPDGRLAPLFGAVRPDEGEQR